MKTKISLLDNSKQSLGIDDLNKEMIEHYKHLRDYGNREFLLGKKYQELVELYSDKKKSKNILPFKSKIMTYEDVKVFMENEVNDIDIILCDDKEKNEEWLLTKSLVSTLKFSQNPGRNLKFLIKINGKIAGIISLASDVISISCRDEFIGWTKDVKMKKLRSTAIASTIVPVQPLGYMTTGGKLLCLLLYNKVFQDIWKEKYGDVLAGITTTSLFGIDSQYLGFPKYWKPLGETKGMVELTPDDEYYKKMRVYLKENHPNELHKAETMPDGTVRSGAKGNVIALYKRITGFNKLWKEEDGRELVTTFKRGVFLSRFYENSLEFLKGDIEEKDLIKKSNLDFEDTDNNQIVNYWKRKWANKRWEKLKDSDNKSVFFMNFRDIENEEQFIKKYI